MLANKTSELVGPLRCLLAQQHVNEGGKKGFRATFLFGAPTGPGVCGGRDLIFNDGYGSLSCEKLWSRGA